MLGTKFNTELIAEVRSRATRGV